MKQERMTYLHLKCKKCSGKLYFDHAKQFVINTGTCKECSKWNDKQLTLFEVSK